jgi:hypothetical protein
MKHLGLKFVFIFSFVFITSTSDAQFIKKLKQSASQGMESAIERKVQLEAEKMMTRQLEKQLGGLFGADSTRSPINFDMEAILAGIGEQVPTAETYNFTGYIVMEIQTKDKKGETIEPMKMKLFLSESSNYTGMEITDPKNPGTITNMIFDMERKASILLMENKESKSSFAYKLDFDQVIDDSDILEEDLDYSIKKTGNTKDILGYSCEEYHMKSEDGEGNYWITEELINDSSSFWSGNSPFATSKMQEKYADHFANMPKGNFMEMDFKSTDGSEVIMKVVDIQASAPQIFLMSEYPNMMQARKQQ